MDTAGQRPRLDRLALDKGRRQRGLFQSLRLDNDRSIKSACPPRFPRSPNGQPSSPHSASLHESLLSPSSAYRSHTDLAQLFAMHFQFDTLNNFYIPDINPHTSIRNIYKRISLIQINPYVIFFELRELQILFIKNQPLFDPLHPS